MLRVKTKLMLYRRLILVAAFIIFAAWLVWLVVSDPPGDADKIYLHMTVHGVAVGGLTPREAERVLQAHFQPELDALRIVYVLENETIAERGFAEFGARFDFSEVVEAAMQYTRTRNIGRRLSLRMRRPHELTLPPVFRFDPARVEEEINEIAQKKHRPPVNARPSDKNGRIVILPETPGRAVNTDAAIAQTTRLLSELSAGTVELTTRVLPPRYSQTDLNFNMSVLGEYATPYIGGLDDPRIRNIRRAAQKIHNQVIFPGEIFSAGTIIGAHLPGSGYETALVLVQGEPVEDVGGGVCQVATTLYNAVLRAELPVVQRHNHSARVSYADFGFDATLAGDWFDLKFKNDTPQPLLITTETGGGRLYIALHGLETRPAGRAIRFTGERVNVVAPGPYKEIPDPALAPGERVVMLEAVPGYTYDVFKDVYMNGKVVERVKVNTSVYRPLQGVMNVGAEEP